MKFVSTAIFSFLFIIFLELIFIVMATGHMPNQVDLEIFNNLSMHLNLLKINTLTMLNFLIFQKPVIIIQNVDSLGTTQVWGFYIMPITFITLVALSIIIARIIQIEDYFRLKYWILLATAFLAFSVFYLRLEACCTAEPNWILDVMLLVRVYDPTLDTLFWQETYLFMTSWFKPMQFIMALIALLLFYKCFLSLKRGNK